MTFVIIIKVVFDDGVQFDVIKKTINTILENESMLMTSFLFIYLISKSQ